MALEKMGVRAVIEGLTSFLGGMKKIDASIEAVGDESKKTAKKTESFADTFAKVATVAASVGAAMLIAKKAFDFAEEGAKLLRLEQSGESLAKSFGTSMDAIVRAVDKASQGTVARSAIILAANKAMLLGVASSADQMAQLMEVAAVRAKAMGLTTTQAFDDIVTGIGRVSPMILDNLGIMTGGEKTFKAYAASIGKAADELTDGERKQALFNKVVEESQGLIQDAAESGEDLATSYERQAAALKNLEDAGKKLLANAITPEIENLSKLLGVNVDILEIMDKYNLKLHLFKGFMDESGEAIARNWKELLVWADKKEEAIEASETANSITLEEIRLRGEATRIARGQADAIEDVATEERKAAREARLLVIETERINQGFNDLQLVMKTDLSKAYEDMLDDIDRVNESEEDLKKRIWEVNQQIGEYRKEIQEIKDEEGPVTEAQQNRIDGFNERISDANGQISDLREELGKVPGKLDDISDAWSRQTKEMIFNLAVQRFGIDGLTSEELKVLGALAGPEGFGLIDEAGQKMIEIIAEAGDVLDLTGDQSEPVIEIFGNLAEEIDGVTGSTDDLIEKLDELTRDTWLIRVEQDLFPRHAGRQMRPTPTNIENDWWNQVQGDIGSSIIAPSGETSTVNEGDNLNLTINTSAPVEPIVEDFRVMRAMGGRP